MNIITNCQLKPNLELNLQEMKTNTNFLGMGQSKGIIGKIKYAEQISAARKSALPVISAGTVLAMQNGKTAEPDIRFTKQQILEIFGDKDVFKPEISLKNGRYWIHLFDNNDIELCVIAGDENTGIVDSVAYAPYRKGHGRVLVKTPEGPFISAITKNLSKDKQNLFFNSKLFDISKPEENLRVTKKTAQQNEPTVKTLHSQLDEYGFSYAERKNRFRKADIPYDVFASLERQRAALKLSRWRDEDKQLENYKLDELEGIQKGTIFEHLTLPQIKRLVSDLSCIIVQRGCNNGCIYCFREAKTQYYMKSHNLANKIDFEDYENLINGFKELNERFGFNIFGPSWALKNNDKSHDLFLDSDCSQIYLEKDGKIYDYADLAKMLNDVTDCTVLFDTAGWSVNDKITQQRMDDLVRKVINNKDFDFINYNISINPFHGIYNKAVENKQNGKLTNYQKLKEIYTDRMANAIFTFSPIIDINDYFNEPRLKLIIRALDNSSKLADYTESEVRNLYYDILKKLEVLYDKDLNSDSPKVIKNVAQKEKYLKYLKEYINPIDYGEEGVDTKIVLTNERLLKKFSKRDRKKQYGYTAEKLKSTIDEMRIGILDVNGDFYLSNDAKTYRTNIYVNSKNRGKPTAPMKPNLMSEIITI